MSYAAVALIAGLIVLGVALWLFWPERGWFWHWRRGQQMTERVLSEDVLKFLHKQEVEGRSSTVESIAGVINGDVNDAYRLVGRMVDAGLLAIRDGEVEMTPQGRESALHIIRAHRLWERYLAEETGYSQVEWHGRADILEHSTSQDQLDALEAQLGYPTHDPHGDPIPDQRGHYVEHEQIPLIRLDLNVPAIISHIEDEPPVVYAQLVAEGLTPGMPVRVMELRPERIRFWANGDEHVLAPLVAANISVVPAAEVAAPDVTTAAADRLTDLAMGQHGEVTALLPSCRGAERRRLMDLGILPGTIITAVLFSPSGDPVAYDIRGALIALRRQQADKIRIKRPVDV